MMRKIYMIASLCALFLSCKVSGQRVSSPAYDQMLDNLLSHTVPEQTVREVDTTAAMIFLDARERREYEVSHIQGAIWVGYDDFDLRRVGEIKKDAPILVYCSVGYRSEKISEKLIEAGYQDVANLYGGIFEWKNQDRPVVNDTGKTEAIHAYDRVWGVWVNEGEKVYK